MERDWRDWRYWPDRPITVMRKVASWFQLTLTGWVALLVALVAMALATVGLLAVSHDVLDHGGLAQHDPSHLNFFIHLRSGWSVEVSRFVTQFGGAGVLVVLAVAAGGLLWWQGARLGVVFAPVLALGSAAALVAVLKPLIHRSRPPLPLRLVTEGEPSFPSGHSTNSAALFLTVGLLVAVVILRRPVARVLAVGISGLVAMSIGLSRLILGVHWPTDVLAGWCLGALVCLLVTTVVLAVPTPEPHPPEGTRRLANAWWRLERVANVRRTHARPGPQPS
jgi:membrane-associated phospholipid phosphatase